ncbi:uncharacterized protein [Nicotiana tomentosiformis]|uniref:uncharacterized protein n=1 Tax=Nicotiana tomentosiformis TaxID=4098 RepID=UPI00388CE4C2
MAPFKALYGRVCHSTIGWFEPGEARLYGTDLVKDALDKVRLIQERICTTQSIQKSYMDQKARDLSFMLGEKVLLKISLMKRIMRFRKKVFHVSMLQKYHAHRSHVLDYITVWLNENLGYEEEPVAIVDKQVHQLRSKTISAIKV